MSDNRTIMCVICFNSQWRSVVIGTISGVITLLSLLFTLGYHDRILVYLKTNTPENECLSINLQDEEETKKGINYQFNGKFLFDGIFFVRFFVNSTSDLLNKAIMQIGRIESSQCENVMIFLSFRFYVKSILDNLEVLKLPFFAIFVPLNFVNLVNFSLQ